MTTFLLSHLAVGIVCFFMGWAMKSYQQKSVDDQLTKRFLSNIHEIKKHLSYSRYN